MSALTRILCLVLCTAISSAQTGPFPITERFDSVTAPSLPYGWTTSVKKNPSGDFVTSVTAPRSGSLPNCLSVSDARVDQYIVSPVISFSGKHADSIEFYERRTGTFTAGMLLEASVDGDTLFSIRISDTLTLSAANNGLYQRRAYALPETLNGRENTRFRWRVIGAPSGGGTAVLRIEDVTVTKKRMKDLAVTSVTAVPSFPRQGEKVTVTAVIMNRAAAFSATGTIELFDSANVISTIPLSRSFAAQETVSIQLPYEKLAAGRHPLTVRLSIAEDEDTTNNSRSLVVTAGAAMRSALINEVMYTPVSGMPEWVEVYNNSAEPLLLSGCRLSDAGSTKALISGTGTIPPYGFAVITTDTNTFKSFTEEPVQLFQASFSALNNGGDAVVLYDRTGAVLDSIYYLSAWGSGTGRSLERIDTGMISTERTSWSVSRHPDGSTPGAVNSVTRKQYDAAVLKVQISPAFPVHAGLFTVTATIGNPGRSALSELTAALSITRENDSAFVSAEVLQQLLHLSPAPGDSASIVFAPESLPQGRYRLRVTGTAAADDDTTNNTFIIPLTVGVAPASIIVSEFMYAPTEGMPEWIELFNNTANVIDITGWTISDNGSAKVPLPSAITQLSAGSYLVLTGDSLQFTGLFPDAPLVLQIPLPSLNNTTPDAIVLRDSRGAVMDSLRYLPQWGGSTGNSLQRYDRFAPSYDSSNWRSAPPSAGTGNAVARRDLDAELRRIVPSIANDGVRIIVTVFNCGREALAPAEVRLFLDSNGDSTAVHDSLIASIPLPALMPLESLQVPFDWQRSHPGREQIIAILTVPQDQRNSNDTACAAIVRRFPEKTFVINEVMSEPVSGRAEFVELFNRSGDTVDVAGWMLMDQASSTGSRTVIPLSEHPRKIPAGGFLLIASDSSFFSEFPAAAGGPVVIHPSLSLSNSGEDIVLADLTGAGIDSVRYSPFSQLKQFAGSGRSLERIDPSSSSNDTRNWSSSVARHGATPLQQNSIFIGSVASSATFSLTPNPFSPDQDGSEDFLSIRYSIPAGSASIRIRIFDVTGRLIRHLANNEPSASSGSVFWDGRDDDGKRVRIGMYIVLLEALDNFGATLTTMKDVAVAARKL